MTKTQLVTKLAEAGEISRKQADAVLTGLTDLVIKSVKKGENLKIPGLGTFKLRKIDLQRAAYAPARCGGDPLFVRDPAAARYVPLTPDALERLGLPASA